MFNFLKDGLKADNIIGKLLRDSNQKYVPKPNTALSVSVRIVFEYYSVGHKTSDGETYPDERPHTIYYAFTLQKIKNDPE